MGIRFEHVTYRYAEDQPELPPALRDLNLELGQGRFITVFGPPGSGKSTLLQLCNGIYQPSEGEVYILDYRIRSGEKLKLANELRRRVGLVFQFPERQLFEMTVLDDLCYGPMNFGIPREKAEQAARRGCQLLGLDEAVLAANPFHLSGGQMRKAAIAAVLAAEPDILVLDEPTASLDPISRNELLQIFRRLCDEEGKTILLVTHRLDEVLPYADEYVLLQQGERVFHGSAAELITGSAELETRGFPIPSTVRMIRRIFEHYRLPAENITRDALTPEGLAAWIHDILARRVEACTVPSS